MRRNLIPAISTLAVVSLLAACGGGAGGPSSGGGKISDDKIVLGVINDQTGIYSALSGPNAVEAVKMAVEDFKAKHADDAVSKNIEVVVADHQNKPEVANTKAQEMYDRQKADIILDVPTSSAALAVASQALAKKKLYFNITAATTALTGDKCNKYTFHYAYDTYMLANGTGTTVTEAGAKNWYIVYPDYAFGQDMEKSFTKAIETSGGKVVGKKSSEFPNTSGDFSSQLLQAPAAHPDVLGTMHAGGELVNLVKQYNQFKLKDKGVGLSVGLMFITDIHSLGPDALAGTRFTDAWYWNFDQQNRDWADKFKEKTGSRPSFAHAGNYSAAMNYLEAVQAAGTDESDAVVKNLEGKEINDFFLRNGKIRAEDHRVIHDVYLAEVKPKSDVKEDYDYEKIVTTIPADKAFKPVSESTCKMGQG
ncbi:ABC transporter substrate-binding protein [Kribbella sp. VKM Ac-2568]|uniref:ABC transporter substrate-binding protein n=1 Tax=Kribbella sp. VKM Ac-2568 TaxID=2512219 RepID=UPI00104AE6C5|nr:ABC transporter substrate-binding protein [Kribbella sp. VKM Ac-2568]TCM39627.1 branched-chain amino acid transport system substrate-binding protein [Kribbella sp. VKM Ac-2568]